MKKLKIKNNEVQEILSGEDIVYPKYVTQLLNLANQNAQATRPRAVGQLSDMIQEFEGQNLSEWRAWYSEQRPDAIVTASHKVYEMILNLKTAIAEVDFEMVKTWVEELIIVKTFAGLKFQEAILKKIAEETDQRYRLATPEEESKNIDGFVGETAISIKPESYRSQQALHENITIKLVYYDKKKDGIVVRYDF